MLIVSLLYLIPELSRINSQAFDITPVEFIFSTFRVIRLLKTGKIAKKNSKITLLTVDTNFFRLLNVFFRMPKMSSFLLFEVLFRSYHEKTIKSLMSRCYRL